MNTLCIHEDHASLLTMIIQLCSPAFKGVVLLSRRQSNEASEGDIFKLKQLVSNVVLLYNKVPDCVQNKGFHIISSGHPHRLKWVIPIVNLTNILYICTGHSTHQRYPHLVVEANTTFSFVARKKNNGKEMGYLPKHDLKENPTN